MNTSFHKPLEYNGLVDILVVAIAALLLKKCYRLNTTVFDK